MSKHCWPLDVCLLCKHLVSTAVCVTVCGGRPLCVQLLRRTSCTVCGNRAKSLQLVGVVRDQRLGRPACPTGH